MQAGDSPSTAATAATTVFHDLSDLVTISKDNFHHAFALCSTNLSPIMLNACIMDV